MKRLIIAFISLLLLAQVCYALDWIPIHEESDRTSLSQALEYVNKEPDSIEKIYLLALVYLNVHKNNEAKEAFSRMLSRDPESIEAQWGLAEVMRRQQKIKESDKALSEIIKSSPEFWPAQITLAYVEYTKEDFKKAIRIATKVSKVDIGEIDLSNHVRSFLIIGGAKGMLASRGGPIAKIVNGTQVLPNLKRGERLQPDSAAVLFGLGSYYLLAPTIGGGNKKKAREYLEKAIEKDPLFADAYVRMAQLYNMLGDAQKSRSYLNKAIEIDPQNRLVQDFKTGKCRFACISVEE